MSVMYDPAGEHQRERQSVALEAKEVRTEGEESAVETV